jgi:hypothetical protein
VWFLNYASTTKEMSKIFETVGMDLEDGGGYVGETPHPTDDIAFLGVEYRVVEHEMSMGVDYMRELGNKEPWRTHVPAVGEGPNRREEIGLRCASSEAECV